MISFYDCGVYYDSLYIVLINNIDKIKFIDRKDLLIH